MSALAASGLSVDDQAMLVEVGDTLLFVADFLDRAEGPLLRADFARFTSGCYSLEELRDCLRRFAGWLGVEERL
ncbi:MAG: hypothetical protein ACRD0N_12700 [Acidimicrobiales bacterium]